MNGSPHIASRVAARVAFHAAVCLILGLLPAAAAPRHAHTTPSHRAHHPTHRKPTAPVPGPAYADRPEVLRFAGEAAARQGLPREWLAMELAQARRIDAARQLILPAAPGVAKNWAAYRARFVEPQRVAAGVAFWQANTRWLTLAASRYGVPANIIVGLLGVETYYGRLTGRFRTLDVLATLSFDYPAGAKDRSDYFRGELEQFFLRCARDGIDPQRQLGSFAGAAGPAQFMPASINRFGVDLDNDGHVDLGDSMPDAIGSVANYLARSGWQPGEPTVFDVQPPADPAARERLLAPDVEPSFSAAQMGALGATLDAAGRAYAGPLALVELQNASSAPSYVAGTGNFRALTRYNRSSYYAMAVIELARAVREALPAR